MDIFQFATVADNYYDLRLRTQGGSLALMDCRVISPLQSQDSSVLRGNDNTHGKSLVTANHEAFKYPRKSKEVINYQPSRLIYITFSESFFLSFIAL